MSALACNPCACGGYTADVSDDGCICGEVVRREYRRRLEGPVIDRIDITREVMVHPADAAGPWDDQPEDSATVRARVAAARARQAQRYAGLPWRLNAHAPAARLRDRWPLPPEGAAAIEAAVRKGTLTRRGTIRVHRMAWTLADLGGRELPSRNDVLVALRLRTGEPLDSWMLRRAA